MLRIVTDRDTGRPKGFGFCEFESEHLAQQVCLPLSSCKCPTLQAVNSLNGAEFMGRSIRVDYANSR